MGIDRSGTIPYVICTSGTRPSTPNEGQMIYETDTDRILFYDGSTWKRTAHDIPHTEAVSVAQVSGNINSTTYAALPAVCAITFTKHRADTRLVFTVTGSAYASGTTLMTWGVNYDGTAANTVECARLFANYASSHATIAGSNQKTGLAAGSYTCSIYWKTTGQWNTDSNDHATLVVTESM